MTDGHDWPAGSGVVDAFDWLLYAAAKARFEADLRAYAITPSRCARELCARAIAARPSLEATLRDVTHRTTTRKAESIRVREGEGIAAAIE